jgi:hypothetical protein
MLYQCLDTSNTECELVNNTTLSLTIQVDLKDKTSQRYLASLLLNAQGQCAHFLLKLHVWIISDNAHRLTLNTHHLPMCMRPKAMQKYNVCIK